MIEIAKNIISIIGDYRNDEEVNLTTDNVLSWVEQFDKGDREFLLNEFLYLLEQGIYLSKTKAKQKLYSNLQELAKRFKYDRLSSFLGNAVFLDLQEKDKSQKHILDLMNELLIEKHNFPIQDCGSIAYKHFIYLDDVLATGNTVYADLKSWLSTSNIQGIPYCELFKENKINIVISPFCYHTWGWANVEFRLSKAFESSKFIGGFIMQHDLRIENNANFHNQKFNCAIPTFELNEVELKQSVAYLHSLNLFRDEDKAFRKSNTPIVETFYSSESSRNKFESIILRKGIEILEKVKDLKTPQIRPLGYTIKSHKTFGLGTLYFTWRNISNTCPLVFWWDNPKHGWKGLFPLKNRGSNKKLTSS